MRCMGMAGSRGDRRLLVVCVDTAEKGRGRRRWHRGPAESVSSLENRQKEKRAPHRGNPRVGPAAVRGGWSDTAPVRHTESRNGGDARNPEKRGLASRGDVKFKGWTL